MTNSAAQARDGGAIAAGVIGGLAAGALLGAAVSESRAAPAYGYGYDYVPPPRPIYRPAPVVRVEEYEAPVYETRRVVSY
ncbi:hypothetical protein, partial [Escherichia coli]|uniref:hypothetical protein n=1 Tax=Escherichia coli TaxID=562 RepID=UPI001954C26B